MRKLLGHTLKREFEIIGNVSGFQDSTYIRLDDLSTGTNIFMDSAQIINGSFVFKGVINGEYQELGLMYIARKGSVHTADIKDFWVEGGVIHFTAKKGDFKNAIITGSPMQEEESLLKTIVNKHPDKKKERNIHYLY